MGATIAIFVPSLNRPWQLERLVNNIRENTTVSHRMYFVVSDEESADILDRLGVNFWYDLGGTWIERNNFLYTKTDEPYIFLGSDDLHFHTGWAEAALEVMKDVEGVVPVNDMLNPNGTSALVSRKYIEEQSGCVDTPNVIAYPGYQHNYADTELFETARVRGKHAYAQNSIVEHLHWGAGKAERDETYQKSDAHSEADMRLFHERLPLIHESMV